MKTPRVLKSVPMVTLSLLVTPELKAWLERGAAEQRRTISWVMRDVLETAMREDDEVRPEPRLVEMDE